MGSGSPLTIYNAGLPLLSDSLQTIRSWSWDFFEISDLNTKCWDSIFLNIICCAQILYDDDWSISGDTIFHDLVTLSDRSRYYHMIKSHDCPDPVHDGVSILSNHQIGVPKGVQWLSGCFVFVFVLFLLLYVPCQQLWSLRDGQFT